MHPALFHCGLTKNLLIYRIICLKTWTLLTILWNKITPNHALASTASRFSPFSSKLRLFFADPAVVHCKHAHRRAPSTSSKGGTHSASRTNARSSSQILPFVKHGSSTGNFPARTCSILLLSSLKSTERFNSFSKSQNFNQHKPSAYAVHIAQSAKVKVHSKPRRSHLPYDSTLYL